MHSVHMQIFVWAGELSCFGCWVLCIQVTVNGFSFVMFLNSIKCFFSIQGELGEPSSGQEKNLSTLLWQWAKQG